MYMLPISKHFSLFFVMYTGRSVPILFFSSHKLQEISTSTRYHSDSSNQSSETRRLFENINKIMQDRRQIDNEEACI